MVRIWAIMLYIHLAHWNCTCLITPSNYRCLPKKSPSSQSSPIPRGPQDCRLPSSKLPGRKPQLGCGWILWASTGDIWGFPSRRGYQNGWFTRDNPIYKWMNCGYTYFRKPPYVGKRWKGHLFWFTPIIRVWLIKLIIRWAEWLGSSWSDHFLEQVKSPSSHRNFNSPMLVGGF